MVKVLAVDDRSENLFALELMLEPLSVELLKVRSGEEALKCLLADDVALILMDVQMPGMDGFETAALIRERDRTRHVPIVFLTAAYESDMHMRGYSLGAVDYLLKPLVPEILKAKVAAFVELHKRAEEIRLQEKANYRILFDNNPRPMWVYDTETWFFLAVNDTAIEQYGYTREEFLAMTIKDIRPAGDVEPALEHAGVWRHKRKDGAIMDVEIASHELPFAGRPARLVVANDITEKKKVEAQLFRTQRMESLGTLAGGIAHDLNNVLTPILMAVQLLKDRVQDESSHHMLETLETSAKRGSAIVRQVLTFARGLEGEKAPVQPRHLLTNMEKMLRETFPKSVQVRLEVPQGLWLIPADPTQLDQVLLNLCVNARDAMPYGGNLTISAQNTILDEHYARLNVQATAGAHVVIEVVDTGQGIPPGIVDKIFDPFFTTKEVGKGTGLGLSTVAAIVKSHGGFVNVYSEIGKGTSFKVYFPALVSAESRDAAFPQTHLPAGNGELILVVDDEAAVRDITRITLESYNYRVATACDGAEGLACYAQQRKDVSVVLLDMMMPILDGPATVRALATIDPNVRIIAASGLLDNTRNNGISGRLGSAVRAVLAKPYTAEKLLTTLNAVIGGTCQSFSASI
jgi:two-component system, cell cycle sensor histidine kinase and response regulator CckA